MVGFLHIHAVVMFKVLGLVLRLILRLVRGRISACSKFRPSESQKKV
jgi:hypothetical protein